MIETNQHLTFQTELQGVQLREVRKKLAEIGEITDEEALKLVVEDEELFKKYLYYTSAKYIQRLKEPKNQDLMEIVNCPDEEKKVKQFNTYIRQEENLKKFQRISRLLQLHPYRHIRLVSRELILIWSSWMRQAREILPCH